MHIAAVAGFDAETDLRPQTGIHESMMDGARRHGHRNRQRLRTGSAIAQKQDGRATADEFNRLRAHVIDRARECGRGSVERVEHRKRKFAL